MTWAKGSFCAPVSWKMGLRNRSYIRESLRGLSASTGPGTWQGFSKWPLSNENTSVMGSVILNQAKVYDIFQMEGTTGRASGVSHVCGLGCIICQLCVCR